MRLSRLVAVLAVTAAASALPMAAPASAVGGGAQYATLPAPVRVDPLALPASSAPLAVAPPSLHRYSTKSTSPVTAASAQPMSLPQTPASPVGSLTNLPLDGLDTQLGWFGSGQFLEPPDNGTAVGTSDVVEMLNSSGSVWTKSGTLLTKFDLTAFFAVGTGFSASDPRVLYDAASGRWFASITSFQISGRGVVTASAVKVAVSTSSDPTGTWDVFSVASSTSELFDQPRLGLSDDKVTLAWDDYALPGETVAGEEVWVLQKSDLVAGTAPASAHFGPTSSWFGLVPVQSLTSTTTQYLVYDNADPTNLVENQSVPTIGVVSVTGTPSAANVAKAEADPAIHATTASPTADQPGKPASLDTGDDRFLNAVWQSGVLWVGGNAGCKPSGDTTNRPCLDLVQLSTSGSTPTVLQDFTLGVSGADLYYPAVGMDAAGDLFVGYGTSASTSGAYPSFEVAGQRVGDPAGTLRPQATVEAGTDTYTDTSCGFSASSTGSRWGDYSFAATDPADPSDVWVSGEYAVTGASPDSAGFTTTGCSWATGAARATFAPPVVTSVSPATGPAAGGTSVIITGSEFTPTSAVSFGGVPAASVTVSSPTSITATSPASTFAGPVDITVTTVNGTSATGPNDVFTYSAPNSVAAVSASPVPDSAGASATYTVDFTTSATGIVPATGTITLTGPAGTDFPSTGGDYAVTDGSAAPTDGVSAVQLAKTGGSATNNQVTITLSTSTIANSDPVTVTANSVANPTAVGAYPLTVTTSADTFPAQSPPYTIVAGAPATVAATAGSGQSSPLTSAFATNLEATVTDAFGNPVDGTTVTFTAPSSGAGGTFSTTNTNAATAVTNTSGVATAPPLTADTTPGTYTVTGRVAGVTTPASYTLTNTTTASVVTASGGTPQSATIGSAFATNLQATVTDSFGNPIQGATVTFTAPSSGASGTFAGTNTNTAAGVTSASGVATAPAFTANATTGTYAVSGRVSGVANQATFSLTNSAASTGGSGGGGGGGGAGGTGSAPGAPSGLTATPGNGSATFTWAAPTGSSPVTSYTVSCSPAASKVVTGTPPPTTTTVTGLTNGTAYSCAVAAANSSGTGPPSNTVTVTPAGSGITPTVYAGSTRVDTAVLVSQASFPTAGSAGAVVLSRSDQYADALAGTPLAVAHHAPVLLSSSSSLDAETQTEIERVLPAGGTVYLLGGTSALSPAVQSALSSAGFQAVRLAGADRYGTAAAIAAALGDPTTVLLASGIDFPDALSAGAAASRVHGAVLLTDGSTMAPTTASYLAAHPGATVYALGGPAATADPGAIAIVGADRYQTAVKTAAAFFSAPTQVGLASGLNFPDALSGGAQIGAAGGPMLLTDPSSLPSAVASYLAANQSSITAVDVYGGPAAVSPTVAAAAGAAA